jgi:6-phosphogluconolactonase
MTNNTARARVVVFASIMCAVACSCSSDEAPGPISQDSGPAKSDAAPSKPAADAGPDFGPAPTGAGPVVYVGGFRPEIDVFRLDMTTAKLTQVGQVANPPMQPSFFAWASSGKFTYSVDEVDKGRVVSYSVDQATGLLTRLNDVPAYGVGPTYIALDRTGKWALTASWAEDQPASISVVPIGADGMVGMPVDSHVFSVNGHAHFITTDPTNKFVFASINGEKYIAQYKFDAATGKLTENTPFKAIRTPTPADPRHLDFHPNGKFLYAINESVNSVTVFGFDSTTGLLTQLQDIPTLPAGFTGMNTTAQILVHKSGKFLYGSNRGHNSIVVYAVDATTGMLTLVGHQTMGVGAHPRNFNFDPTGTLLLVASRDEGTVSIFKVDQTTGMLQPMGAPVPVGVKPTYVGVLNVPGM